MDIRAKCINEEMKIAAVQALAELAHENIPEEMKKNYGIENMKLRVHIAKAVRQTTN